MSTSWHDVEVGISKKGNPYILIPVGFNGDFYLNFDNAVLVSLYADEIHAFWISEGKKGSPNIMISEYKRKPIIELTTHNPKFPLKFGVAKAGAVVECLEHIDRFVNENDKSIPADKGVSNLIEANEEFAVEGPPEYEQDVYN